LPKKTGCIPASGLQAEKSGLMPHISQANVTTIDIPRRMPGPTDRKAAPKMIHQSSSREILAITKIIPQTLKRPVAHTVIAKLKPGMESTERMDELVNKLVDLFQLISVKTRHFCPPYVVAFLCLGIGMALLVFNPENWIKFLSIPFNLAFVLIMPIEKRRLFGKRTTGKAFQKGK